MTRTALLFALTFIAATLFTHSSPGLDKKSTEFTQAVSFKACHDPGFIVLADGRELIHAYKNKSFEVIRHWRKGQTLSLKYSSDFGLRLVDKRGRFVPIFLSSGEHPIDSLVEQWDDKQYSTLAMCQHRSKARELWDAELNRAYKLLRASLKKQQALTLRASQRAWMKYRDAQVKSIQAIYGSRSGSIQSLHASNRILDLTREQAEKLYIYYTD